MPTLGLGHMASEIAGVVRGETHAHRMLGMRIKSLLVITALFALVGTLLMYLFEHDARGSGFDDLGGALFFVSSQLTTVSSSMPNPVTSPGRLVDVVLEVWGILAATTLAGAFGAFFRARHVDRMPAES